LSTATAVTALIVSSRDLAPARLQTQIRLGLNWLAAHANADGGWGDTSRNLSNLSTTTLCWAAFGAARALPALPADQYGDVVSHAEDWIQHHVGGLDPDRLGRAIIARYGKDRTFSVPILTMCALAGRLGSGRGAWRRIIPLPFELAACPPGWFAALRLPVVSYALPALIAIGQARHHHAPSRNPLTRWLRHLTRQRTLRVLSRIQPANGGFLEATPLTSFVTMSLAGSGQADHPVARKGVDFLLASQRPDGSWPIDTNLATWVTTLSVNALGPDALNPTAADAIRDWLFRQQFRTTHPYTQAAAGGWAWTDLPGGVPDADDTAGALLALHTLRPGHKAARQQIPDAVLAGLNWLLDLQNRDGGIPTFCRGWGTLPFDRSSADITAHALRAWWAWTEAAPPALQRRLRLATERGLKFLEHTQHADGSWAPLWFGNQHAADETNRVYGTARVVNALAQIHGIQMSSSRAAGILLRTGGQWLSNAQNSDGGWGGAPAIASSVEETALAVEALVLAHHAGIDLPKARLAAGLAWLVDRVESGRWQETSPIGFYFARLWYFERLYPLIFTVGALNVSRRTA
jgi:squalene-hopene/tetraprenyl-beta-curcumene cyclase